MYIKSYCYADQRTIAKLKELGYPTDLESTPRDSWCLAQSFTIKPEHAALFTYKRGNAYSAGVLKYKG